MVKIRTAVIGRGDGYKSIPFSKQEKKDKKKEEKKKKKEKENLIQRYAHA